MNLDGRIVSMARCSMKQKSVGHARYVKRRKTVLLEMLMCAGFYGEYAGEMSDAYLFNIETGYLEEIVGESAELGYNGNVLCENSTCVPLPDQFPYDRRYGNDVETLGIDTRYDSLTIDYWYTDEKYIKIVCNDWRTEDDLQSP